MKEGKVIYTCAVPECKSAYSLNCKDRHFFRLPQKEPYRTRWIEKLCLTVPHNSIRICDLHFGVKSFSSTLRQRLMKYAVPTIKNPEDIVMCDKNTNIEKNEDISEEISDNMLVSQLEDAGNDSNDAQTDCDVIVIQPGMKSSKVSEDFDENHEFYDMDVGESIVIVESDNESQENCENQPEFIEAENVVIDDSENPQELVSTKRKRGNVLNAKLRNQINVQRCMLRWQRAQIQKMTTEIGSLKYTVGRLRKCLRKLRNNVRINDKS